MSSGSGDSRDRDPAVRIGTFKAKINDIVERVGPRVDFNLLHTTTTATTDAITAVFQAGNPASFEEAKAALIGKKSQVKYFLGTIPKIADPEVRKQTAQFLNEVSQVSREAEVTARSDNDEKELEKRLSTEGIDVTLPVRPEALGRIHPISQTIDEVIAIFGEMGFAVAEGPDIEDDWHNFTALNIPPEHPARQEMDTFYLPGERDGHRVVLRTHTSPVQIRTMVASPPPLRIIAPGRTYRCDLDATHSPMFHQVEGLIVDETVHMGHLKGCLIDFLRAFFGVDELPVRFRPSYFPFTEPSAEVDIGCTRSAGRLEIGHGSDWLEILGCGMVNPKVLAACGIDPARYQGFAFGMGIERITMLKYGIPDLRTFFDSDLRWLRHYGFAALAVPSLVRGE